MNRHDEPISPADPATAPKRPLHSTATLTRVALCLGIAAGAWFLLQQLVFVLRPLLLAGFFCYIIVPLYRRLTRRIPNAVAYVVMAGASVGVLSLLAVMIYASVLELSEELPQLTQRAQDNFRQVKNYFVTQLPWLAGLAEDSTRAQTQSVNQLRDAVNGMVNVAAGILVEALIVGVYLIFLLLESSRFPQRIRGAFAGERSEHVLAVVGSINEAIASYLRVKVKASLLLAVPAALVMMIFHVKFAVMWGVLTFFGNFIPYLGSIVFCSLPSLLAFLQMDFGWQPITVTVLLVAIHASSAYLIEPTLTGKEVGLSPLVILAALAFWGQCWGLIGMLLAVPLTAILKIVLENVTFTRPFARLLADK